MTEIDRERYAVLPDLMDDLGSEGGAVVHEGSDAIRALLTRLAEVEGENARLREAVTSGQALSQQAAHVAIGASVPAMDIRQAALNLVKLVNDFDAASDAALTGKGTTDDR